MVDGDLRYDNLARKRADDNVRRAVIAAYTGALKSSEAMRRCALSRHSRGPCSPPSCANNLLCGLVLISVTRGPWAVIGKDGPQPCNGNC